MSVFAEYSAYYDALYRDKDYAAEAAYVLDLLRRHDPSVSSLVDLGCGSGKHSLELARQGLRVTGVDRSAEMLREAARLVEPLDAASRPRFFESDIVTFRAPEPVDAAVALFHVVSYLTAGQQLETFLANVARSLAPGGLFLFDFWYGPAVLAQKPSVRVKRVAFEGHEVVRIAEPELHDDRNVVDVHYTLFIESAKGGTIRKLSESHSMRYFFLPEIEEWLGRGGFRILDRHEWMTRGPLSVDTWSATVIAQRS
ncbi:MAG TPA: class I SAM-dependent methyltransferase [Thermoanaerobaculia bacterium]